MAKLSSVNQQPGLDDLESLKRRYQRQNRELARANATQQQTISALNAEISQHSTENLRLRAEIISLRKQLDERDAQGLTPVSAKAKSLLQEKLAEIAGLINELSDNGVDRKTRIPGSRFPLAVKPDLTGRERPEGFLSDIPEYNERVSPATPRRPFVCLGPRVDAIVRAAEEGSPIKDYYLPLQEFNSGMFDVRPRRKRNSNSSESLIAERVPVSSFNSDLQAGAAASPQKRKWDSVLTTEELGAILRSPMVKDSDLMRPATPPSTDPEEVKMTLSTTSGKEAKDTDTDAPLKKESTSAASPVKLDLATASRFLSSNRKSLENVRDLVNQPTPELEPTPEPELQVESVPSPTLAPLAESRRALEPKSTNVHVGLSPAKLPTVADFEYVKKDKTSPRDRESVKKASRMSSKPIVVQGVENTMVEEKAAGAERSRRTRGVAVNYALPALNKKMRRDTEALVDAVTGIRPKRRTSTAEEGAVEDIERRTSKMSIHHDAKREAERPRNIPDRSGSRMSEQELDKMMTEKVRDAEGGRDREREARIREARKDLYEFTTANSSATDALDIARRTSLGSHQRRTSGGLSGISAISSSTRDGDKMTSAPASSGNVKSASDIIEERRRRRATLAATGTSTATATTGEVKARRSVEFASSVIDRERGGVTDRRRRSMVV
ncbi:uncharacterized protein DFL_009095 [Arthrobotrys flagrans]|uniref:Shugoshin C-terminal domain-containing protein n=1 Tax=Arthrobotrys flagrans TaxID=97331 RepID=A0A436ZQP1_ARTFL|nr:hypothetical protein DFL_009095 [Arthrobotrys flagrans]